MTSLSEVYGSFSNNQSDIIMNMNGKKFKKVFIKYNKDLENVSGDKKLKDLMKSYNREWLNDQEEEEEEEQRPLDINSGNDISEAITNEKISLYTDKDLADELTNLNGDLLDSDVWNLFNEELSKIDTREYINKYNAVRIKLTTTITDLNRPNLPKGQIEFLTDQKKIQEMELNNLRFVLGSIGTIYKMRNGYPIE